MVFKFGSRDYLQESKTWFWSPFGNKTFLNVHFADLWCFTFVQIRCKFRGENLTGKCFIEGVHLDSPVHKQE